MQKSKRGEDDCDGRAANAAGGGLPALPVAGAMVGRRAPSPPPGKVVELPRRKVLNHRGPLSIDVSAAWYFITICAEDHQPWCVDGGKGGRAARPLAAAAGDLFSTVRHYMEIGKWHVALFLVMPDHLHFIVHVPIDGGSGGQGSARPTTLESVVADFKHAVSRRFGLKFQRDFWDTRLRDDAHYAEKFRYVCNNPVRKGLCATARDWPHVIAFDRETGEERQHK